MFRVEVLRLEKVGCNDVSLQILWLFRHHWISLLDVIDHVVSHSCSFSGFPWKVLDSVSFIERLSAGTLVSLIVLRLIASTLRVDVVTQHVLTIDWTSIGWVCISLSISVPGWLSKESLESRIWEPSSGLMKIVDSVNSVFLRLFHSSLSSENASLG